MSGIFENAPHLPCLWLGTAQVATNPRVSVADAPDGVIVARFVKSNGEAAARGAMTPEQARALAAVLIAAADTIEKGKP